MITEFVEWAKAYYEKNKKHYEKVHGLIFENYNDFWNWVYNYKVKE